MTDDALLQRITQLEDRLDIGQLPIRYDDWYRKVDGEWLFERRRERHWYATDLNDPPQRAEFNSWAAAPAQQLPQLDDSWSSFRSGCETDQVTRQP